MSLSPTPRQKHTGGRVSSSYVNGSFQALKSSRSWNVLITQDNYFCCEKISSSHGNLHPLFRTLHSIKKTGYWVKFVNIDVNVSFSSSSQGTFTKNGSSKWRRDIIPITAMMRVATYHLLPSANISMSNNFVNGTFSLITCQFFITYLVGITNYSTLFISTPLKGEMFLVESM